MTVQGNKEGFTLVELLVVIAIIGILAAVGMVMYAGAQKNGRIAKRIQDLKAIQTALELYYSVNKKYPQADGGTSCNPAEVATAGTGLVPTYMPVIPSDSFTGGCYKYTTNGTTGTDYKLTDSGATEMTSNDYKTQQNLIDPNKDGGSDSCKVETGYTVTGWAIYSSATSACW